MLPVKTLSHRKAHVRAIARQLPVLVLSATAVVHTANAAESPHWSLVPTMGFSQISSQQARISATADIDGNYSLDTENGFVAGLGLRYRYGPQWETELAWEYRSNDSTLLSGVQGDLPAGNYASNIFAINGRRYFDTLGAWSPFVGAGVQWVQEVDLDSEDASGERSFSAGGDVGIQIMAGGQRRISDAFSLSAELRYGSISGLELSEEGSAGSIGNLDYQPLSLSLGLAWNF